MTKPILVPISRVFDRDINHCRGWPECGAGFFLVHLGSNSSPTFGLTQSPKFSNSAHFVLTKKNTFKTRKFLDFHLGKEEFFKHFQ